MNILNFLYKVVKFFKNYLLHDPVFVMTYGLAYFRSGYTPLARFYTDEELVTEIQSGKSIIRIGDGEIGLMHHRDISYQRYEKSLVEGLIDSIENYNEASRYVLSIPIFVNYSNAELAHTNGKLACWLPLKVEFFRRFNPRMSYMDAHFFYRKGYFEERLAPYLKNKKLIVNTLQKNIDEQRSRIEERFTVLRWIPSQSPNPYDKYEETVREIDKCVDSYLRADVKNKKSDIVLILSAGPMSKVLAYHYAKCGVQAFDIGKGFEQVYNEVNYEHEI